MALNLHHLAVFHAVAETGGVTLGAERLLISQPAVSKQIKQLERFLDAPLLERHARGVALTPAGELLLGYARRIFGLAEEAEQAVADLSALRRGRLSIGASPTIATYLLPKVLVYFRQRFPGIELRLEIENAPILERRLLDSELDLGLTEVHSAERELASSIFAEDELVLIAPPRHPLTRRRTIQVASFADQPFVVRETGSATRSLAERALAEAGVQIRPVLALGTTEAVKQAVAAGLGIGLVSRLAAQAEIAAKRLSQLRVTGFSARRPLYHVRRRGRYESKAAIAFLCILKHEVRGTLPQRKRRSDKNRV